MITPSHNPPEDGGFKYNPPNGGPADTDVTARVQNRANELLRAGLGRSDACPDSALTAAEHAPAGFRPAVRGGSAERRGHGGDPCRGTHAGVDPLGGAAAPYWEPINALYRTQITVVNPALDPTFAFMTVDHDGRIRMDCSSPYAMAGLVGLKDRSRSPSPTIPTPIATES